jgi:8-oxo-dGTP pyrophosphatase MutT (NUDIX family)
MTTDFLNDSVGEVMIESNELAQDDALIESFRPYRQHILNGSVRADVRISYGLIPCCYRGNQVLVQLCKERFSDEYSDFICMRMPLWELERFMSLFYEDELRRVMKFSPKDWWLDYWLDYEVVSEQCNSSQLKNHDKICSESLITDSGSVPSGITKKYLAFKRRYEPLYLIIVKIAERLLETGKYRRKIRWCFPKGRRDDGEEPIACAVREFREETSLSCAIRIISDFQLEEIFKGSDNKIYKNLYYIALLDNAEKPKKRILNKARIRGSTISSEMEEVRWEPITKCENFLDKRKLTILSIVSEILKAI